MNNNKKLLVKTSPMTIVFGVNSFFVGGMQRQFTRQLHYFNRGQFRIILITLFQSEERQHLYNKLPHDLEVHRLNFRGFADVISWWRLLKLLRIVKPDIVVSSLFFSNTVFRILKPLCGYVSIAREHNTFSYRLSYWQRLTNRLLACLTYRIVAVSQMVADTTSRIEGVPRKKFVVINNGIDVQEVGRALDQLPDRNSLREKLGFSNQDLIFLNVARLTTQKSHKLLLDGFALFVKNRPEAKLIIIGDGPLKQELETYAEVKGLENLALFYGHHDDVWPFYKLADIFVSVSQIEGFPNTYLEALASSLPIVTTRVGGVGELIKDGQNGFVIEDNSPRAVAKALEDIIETNRKQLTTGAFKTVSEFSIQENVQRYENLFSEIATKL